MVAKVFLSIEEGLIVMRKKVIKYALMTLLCISFTGCNGKRTLTEEEIRKEIQAKDVFYSQGLEIKEFEIIKRQTDTADREDVIYIHVEGENLDFSVVRNYKLTYLLYNDGWKLETIEPYSDVEYYIDELEELDNVFIGLLLIELVVLVLAVWGMVLLVMIIVRKCRKQQA